MISRDMTGYQKTSLRNVGVKIKIGIADWERKAGRKQKVVVELDLFRFRGAFTGKTIRDCINYDLPYQYIMQTWPARPHTDLLETLAEELVAFCLRMKGVDAVRVAISKPEVYKGKAVPCVEFFRTRKKKKP